MSESKPDATQRLERVRMVFAARRARLASEVVREAPPIAAPRSLVGLQHHGYSVALMLALTAVLPSAIGFALRRRKLVFSALTTGLRVRKWRTRLKSMNVASRGR